MGGHPCTTGLPNIDYFISGKDVEIEKAQNNYSEQLIRLKNSPTAMQYDPIMSLRESVERYENQEIKIGIVHSLFKINPSFDKILEEISQINDNIEFILFESPQNLVPKIKSRWLKSAPNTLKKSKFLPRVEYDKFIQIIKTLDIMLDPIGFGAGTVCYQAMACGVPLVSLPTSQLKTRAAVGCYKRMEIRRPPIAKNEREYIDICRELIESYDRRKELSTEIALKAKSTLYKNTKVLKEIEVFIRDAVFYRRQNKALPTDWSANI